MAQPSASTVHIDVPLSNVSVAYIQSQSRFISTRVFPIVPVEKQTDKYFKYTKGDWFRDEAELVGDAAGTVGSGYNLSSDSYSADVWGIHKDIGRQTRGNADGQVDPEVEATEFVTQRILMRRERQFITDAFATGIWGTSATPSILWDNAASDPETDVDTAKDTILQNTGFEANTMVLGYQVFQKLKRHPAIGDRYKYTSSDVITEQMLAQLFGVDRLFVGKTVYNSAVEGATASMAFTYGKHALLCHVPPSAALRTPSAGYTFSWRNGVSGGNGLDVGIRNFYMENEAADRIEGKAAFDHKIVATDLGYFLESVIS